MRGVVAAIVAIAGLLAGCSSDDVGELEIGSIVVSRIPVDTDKTRTQVLVPTGRLTFRLGKPQRTLSASQSPEGEQVEAPAGGSFVPLRWSYRTRVFEGAKAVFGDQLSLSVTLVADDEEYQLTPPSAGADGESESHLFVAVAGRPKEFQLKVEYAGVTQRADLRSGEVRAGRAALLTRMTDFDIDKHSACRTDGWEASGVQPYLTWGCTYTDVAITPFLDGHFARRGYAYAVLGLRTNLEGRSHVGKTGVAVFLPTKVTDRTTLDGNRALRTMPSRVTPRRPGLEELVLAWRVRGDEDGRARLPETIRFEQRYRVRLDKIKGLVDVRRKRDRFTLEGDIPVVLHRP